MSRLAFGLLALTLPACLSSSGSTTTEPVDPELVLAGIETTAPARAWDVAPTLHVNARSGGVAAANGRRVFPIWLAGSAAAPLPLDVVALANSGDDVRVAVLGPLRAGSRAVIAAAGYSQPRGNIEMSLEITTSGEHLLVVGAFDLARATAFSIAAHSSADPEMTDVLADPKDGGLVGGGGIVSAVLGNALADRTFDVELELWASPPAVPSQLRKVATSQASGNQVNIIVPPGVTAGDDLQLRVRDGQGKVLDSGVSARYAPSSGALVRTDALVYGTNGSLGASGIVGMFEGHAHLALLSESRNIVIAETTVMNDRPGQTGNGWAAFDAVFEPAYGNAADGEPVSIAVLRGDGEYQRLACFAYRGARTACP
ncbi:MAG: hypothetical protein H0T46_32590 [Deltaproteobacteria bacterium]|nr:hypothetical protein [Deltaproteobacteria bacterium]